MEVDTVPKPYDTRNEVRSLFNNPKLSDVRFLVDGQTVYGHKFILRMGSPVFESMFFGDLKEQREVIEIEDLTLAGFKNALRYIYGFKINFKSLQLYETYLAADKYLLCNFNKAFSDYIKSRLCARRSCLIYDQLFKIGEREEILLAYVRTVVIKNAKKAFESNYFTQISQETLVSLLSLRELSIDEVDLLDAVSRWVDCEVQRQGLLMSGENRRRVFEPIKNYILFPELTPENVANCKKIAELFAIEEIDPLLLHLLTKRIH